MVLTAALTACGGGSGSTDATPPVPPTGAFAGTAYLKTQNTVLYNGKNLLHFDTRRAIGNKYFDDKLPLATASEFAAFPAGKFVGQTCREVTGPGGTLIDGKSCIWDIFPFVRCLNWPFALSGRVQFGPSAALVETIKLIEAARNQTIAASVFQIPAGFAVTPP